MDRLDERHITARVDLPESISGVAAVQAGPAPRSAYPPAMRAYAGLLGFVGCSAVVIATASLIALRIQ